MALTPSRFCSRAADVSLLADLCVRLSFRNRSGRTRANTLTSTASLAVWRILNRQISQLRRTVANAVTLQNLSQAALMPAPTPAFFSAQRHINLPPLTCRAEELSAGECSSAPNDRELGGFRAKLARLRAFRRVYTYQALATGYTMIAAVVYGGELSVTRLFDSH